MDPAKNPAANPTRATAVSYTATATQDPGTAVPSAAPTTAPAPSSAPATAQEAQAAPPEIAPETAVAPASAAADKVNTALAELQAELQAIGAKLLFEKTLTLSDGNGQGRIVIPKAQAEAHLPHLESQGGISMSCIDTRGGKHPLKFRFWTNSQSRMYLLEGTQDVQNTYKLQVGDVLVFARTGKGELVLCGRPGTSADVHRKPPVRKAAAPGEKPLRERKPRNDAAAASKRRRGNDDRKSASGQQAAQQQAAIELKYEPMKDGIFRALPDGTRVNKMGVLQWRGGWLGVLSIQGEVYHAFFSSQEAAAEAMLAAAT